MRAKLQLGLVLMVFLCFLEVLLVRSVCFCLFNLFVFLCS